jgi:hypothetical protein
MYITASEALNRIVAVHVSDTTMLNRSTNVCYKKLNTKNERRTKPIEGFFVEEMGPLS